MKVVKEFGVYFLKLNIWEQVVIITMLLGTLIFIGYSDYLNGTFKIKDLIDYLALIALFRLHYMIGQNKMKQAQNESDIKYQRRVIRDIEADIKDIKLQLQIYIRENTGLKKEAIEIRKTFPIILSDIELLKSDIEFIKNIIISIQNAKQQGE